MRKIKRNKLSDRFQLKGAVVLLVAAMGGYRA